MRNPVRRLVPAAAAALCLACALPAAAQWNPSFTANLGAGYGAIALSQSVIGGTRRIGTDTRDQAPKAQPAAPGATANALTYTPDAAVSEQVRAAVIDSLSRQNPALKPQMEQAFANDAVLKTFDQFMSSHGYSSRNVADDMAALLVVSWEIATGNSATAGQIRGADRQAHGIFSRSAQLSAMSNAQRQEMAEHIAYQVVIAGAAKNEYLKNGDQPHLAQLRQSVLQDLNRQGIDLAHQRLTDQGFVKAA